MDRGHPHRRIGQSGAAIGRSAIGGIPTDGSGNRRSAIGGGDRRSGALTIGGSGGTHHWGIGRHPPLGNRRIGRSAIGGPFHHQRVGDGGSGGGDRRSGDRGWHPHQGLNPRTRCRGRLRRWHHFHGGRQQDHPQRHPRLGHVLETGQPPGDRPRPAVRRKTQRDRRLSFLGARRCRRDVVASSSPTEAARPTDCSACRSANAPRTIKPPKALACYGRLVRCRPVHTDQIVLRFVTDRSVSAIPTGCLRWGCERLAAKGIAVGYHTWPDF